MAENSLGSTGYTEVLDSNADKPNQSLHHFTKVGFNKQNKPNISNDESVAEIEESLNENKGSLKKKVQNSSFKFVYRKRG